MRQLLHVTATLISAAPVPMAPALASCAEASEQRVHLWSSSEQRRKNGVDTPALRVAEVQVGADLAPQVWVLHATRAKRDRQRRCG